MPAFADTSFFVACLGRHDAFHSQASQLMASYADSIVTTDWVLVELGNYLAGRPSRRLFGPFVNDLSRDSRFQIFPANAEWLDDGIKLYEQRPDKEWSLTDCLSFVVMKNEGLLDAITTDHHFEQAGFHILLKPE